MSQALQASVGPSDIVDSEVGVSKPNAHPSQTIKTLQLLLCSIFVKLLVLCLVSVCLFCLYGVVH